MLFTVPQLAQIMQCPAQRAEHWHPHLIAAAEKFGISTRRRAAHWLAQMGHESGSLTRLQESLTYSRERLLEVFGHRIPAAQASRYVNAPQALGCFVYANRNGNGDVASGDGYLYRGRAPMQHTGRGNYRRIGELIGLPLEDQPELLLGVEAGALGAAAFWHDNGLSSWADANDTLAIGRKINLGRVKTARMPNGHADRVTRTNRALTVLQAA